MNAHSLHFTASAVAWELSACMCFNFSKQRQSLDPNRLPTRQTVWSSIIFSYFIYITVYNLGLATILKYFCQTVYFSAESCEIALELVRLHCSQDSSLNPTKLHAWNKRSMLKLNSNLISQYPSIINCCEFFGVNLYYQASNKNFEWKSLTLPKCHVSYSCGFFNGISFQPSSSCAERPSNNYLGSSTSSYLLFCVLLSGQGEINLAWLYVVLFYL